jgi:hypothetical protein
MDALPDLLDVPADALAATWDQLSEVSPGAWGCVPSREWSFYSSSVGFRSNHPVSVWT